MAGQSKSGVRVVRKAKTQATHFPIGSILAIQVDDELSVSVGPNTSLRISSACAVSDDSLWQTLYYKGKEGGPKSEWVPMCRLTGDQKTTTGFDLICDGPRTFSLRLGSESTSASVSVFGSVRPIETVAVPSDNGSTKAAPERDDTTDESTVKPPEQSSAQKKRKRSNAGDNADQGKNGDRKDVQDKNDKKKANNNNNDNNNSNKQATTDADPTTGMTKDQDSAKPDKGTTSDPKQDSVSSPESKEMPSPMSKKQRRKLAKQKAKELADLVKATNATVNKDGTVKTKDVLQSAEIVGRKDRRLPGGIFVKDLMVGAGGLVKPGRKVSILYEGAFQSGQVFDKNRNRKSPLTFRQGTGQVVRGLEKGVEGMRVGGMRQITIPPDLAYGKKGSGNVIPPNSTLVFSVEVVSVG